MRLLCGFGALALLYLALIPIGLIYSTVDSACAGPGCESSTLLRLAFTVIYAACGASLLGTAALFASYALGGGLRAERRLPGALALTGIVVGTATFSLFLIAFPAGGMFALSLAAATYLMVRVTGRGGASDSRDPSTNGAGPAAGSSNGNRALPDNGA